MTTIDLTECSDDNAKTEDSTKFAETHKSDLNQATTTTTHQSQSIDMNEEKGGMQRRDLYKELQQIIFKSLRPEIADLKFKDKMPILKSHWDQIKADPEWRTKLESIRKQYYLSKEAAAEIRAQMKAKERKERAERRKREMERKESPAVKGEYSEFTDVFGVFVNGYRNCSRRFSSLEAANESASEQFQRQIRSNGDMEETEIMSENPFHGWTTINDCAGTLTIEVQELDITQCSHPELKVIAKREQIDLSVYKSKKDLVYILKYRIQHKKHRNNGEALNIRTCLFCQKKYPQKYKEYQDELDRNPVVIENRKINKMYQKSMKGAITENKVSKEYGYSFKQLKQGIIDQELHWSWKNYYGTTYRVFWSYEIERWQLKLQKEKEEQEQRELESQRKRTLSDVDLEEKVQSVSKKRKLNESKENDVDCEEGLIDYMGVPPQLRKHQWLYDPANTLQQADREKIIRFMFGSYTRSDFSTEDVVLDQKEGVRSVLRLTFQPKAGWKKLTIRRRVRDATRGAQ